MRWTVLIIMLLAWYAASAFAVWLLYTHGHIVWAVIVALICASSPKLTEKEIEL